MQISIPKFLVNCFLFLSFLFQGYSNDSLIYVIKHKSDTNAVNAYYELAKNIYLDGNLDSAYVVFLNGAELADSLNFTNGKIKIWRGLGSIDARNGNFEESKLWLEKGLSLIEKENLPIINKVDYLINLGVAYYFKGEISSALKPYIEATKICRENGFDAKRSKLLNNLGIFYRTLKRYDEALDIYKESLELRTELNDTLGMANNLFNMTAVYSYMGDYNKTLETASKAKVLYQKINSESDIILSTLSMGTALVSLERYEEAFQTLNELKEYKELPFDPEHEFIYHLNMAKLHLKRNEFSKVNWFLNKIESKLFATDMIRFQTEFYEIKSDYYQKNENYYLSNEYLRKYIKSSQEFNEIENRDVLKEMETKYLTKEKDYQIAMLDSESKLNEIKLNAANQKTLFLSFGAIILSLLAGALFFLYRKIKLTNTSLEAANHDKEILLKEIHHRVKNNLQVISALLSLQSKYINDENALEAIRKGHDRVESMALIHKDLYQHDSLKGVNTQDYLEKLIDNLFNSYNIQESDIKLELDISPIYLDVDTMIPLGLLINELVSNSLKHAFNKLNTGKLFISLRENENQLELIVKDNGIGKIKGHENDNNSFGYSLIKSFARKLDADIEEINSNGLEIVLKIRDYIKVA